MANTPKSLQNTTLSAIDAHPAIVAVWCSIIPVWKKWPGYFAANSAVFTLPARSQSKTNGRLFSLASARLTRAFPQALLLSPRCSGP